MIAREGRRLRRAVTCLATGFLLLPALAAAQVPEYALKAEFLERFTRFVDWPAGSAVQDASSPFVVGVYGTNPFGGYLTALAAERRFKGKPAEVRVVTTPDDAARCALLFVPASERRHLGEILARTADRPVLTVSETEGAAERGVLVNFYVAEQNLRFEINDGAVRRSGLQFSSRLLKLARVVNMEPRP